MIPETAEALESAGIVDAFPIQELTLPVALAGSDIIGQAKTGTGKTLAFGIPLLQKIVAPADPEPADGRPQALIVVPTRELCLQVTSDLEAAGKVRGVRTLAVYGGRAYEPQTEALAAGVEVVVGTPGRLLDLARQQYLDLSVVRMLVLDEADEMLDLGFLPDVERILKLLPQRRQTMLFSATMSGPVVTLARQYMHKPTHIHAHDPEDTGAVVNTVQQHVFRAHAMDKPELLTRILQARGRTLAMVFCRTKRTCQVVADELRLRGFAAAAVHGDLGQNAREQALRAFRSGKVDVLVATDVAARGIDVEGISHVVNYQCPEDQAPYVHRIGRTGRAGASGVAVTLVDWEDLTRWRVINNALGLPFADPPETYSSSAHLYEALDIPADAGKVLPRNQRTRAGLDAEELEPDDRPGRQDGERGRRQAEHPPRERRRTRGGTQAEQQVEQQIETAGQRRTPQPAEPESVAVEPAAPVSRARRDRTHEGRSDETAVRPETAGEEVVGMTADETGTTPRTPARGAAEPAADRAGERAERNAPAETAALRPASPFEMLFAAPPISPNQPEEEEFRPEPRRPQRGGGGGNGGGGGGGGGAARRRRQR